MMFLHVKALSVHDNGNGTFSIKVPDREMSQEEVRVLESLFPNVREAVEKLLDEEALLACQATAADLMAKPRAKPTVGKAFDSRMNPQPVSPQVE